MGSTWCGGSGYVIRRAAIEDIGGFPTESVGEDMYCSNVLLGRGWNAIYVDETLQSGRVPESYKAHVKQQGRWVRISLSMILELMEIARWTITNSHRYAFLSLRKESSAYGFPSTYDWTHLRNIVTLQYPHHDRHGHIARLNINGEETCLLQG